MRRSFDGLHALVTDSMQLDAFAGHLFVFSKCLGDDEKIGVRWRPISSLPPFAIRGISSLIA
jgi:hypothetical protein